MTGCKGASPHACAAGGSRRVGMTTCTAKASGDQSKDLKKVELQLKRKAETFKKIFS